MKAHWDRIVLFFTRYNIFFVIVAMMLTQIHLQGFPGGHHGWVTSHNMALASNTNFDNLLVGYTLRFNDDYYYFLRSPFVSYLIMGLPQHIFYTFSDQIFYTKILNILVIALTIFIFQRILEKNGISKVKTVSITLFAFSGHYITYYRDLITPDIYSLLGIAIGIYGICSLILENNKRSFYICTLVSPMLGWGYSVIPLFGIFWITDTFAKKNKIFSTYTTKNLFAHTSFYGFALSVFITVLFIFHNIIAESIIRQVPLLEVGIIKSAFFRLGFDENSTFDLFTWMHYLYEKIAKYFMKGFTPIWLANLSFNLPFVKPIIMSVIFLVVAISFFYSTRYLIHVGKKSRYIFILTLLAGPAWLIPMRNLARFHDYTAIVFCASYIVLFAGVIHFIPKKRDNFLVLASLLTFFSSNYLYMQYKDRNTNYYNKITEEFETIRMLLPKNQHITFDPEYSKIVPGVPLAVGYYLQGHFIQGNQPSMYTITNKVSNKSSQTVITPSHKNIFLLKNF